MKNYYTGRGVEIHPNLYHTHKNGMAWYNYEPLDPGPHDLTEQKIADRMSKIYVGDRIVFDSMKACITSNQCDRHSSYVKATGTVVEHCGGYVMVKLNHLLESVNYFDIEAVNGKRWPWYLKKDIYPAVEVMGTTWKK